MSQGAVTPGYDLMSDIRKILELHLKDDAHTVCWGRLFVPIMELVSVTPDPRCKTTAIVPQPTKKPDVLEFGGKVWRCGEKKVVSTFSSREELIEVGLGPNFMKLLNFAEQIWSLSKTFLRTSQYQQTLHDNLVGNPFLLSRFTFVLSKFLCSAAP